jgi:hypothetical protein
MLHESWNKNAAKAIPLFSKEAGVIKDAYIEGASDFQTKALEELEKYKQDCNCIEFNQIHEGIDTAIEIIKNLKAE